MPNEATINGMTKPMLLELMRSTIAEINTIKASIALAENYKTKTEASEQSVNGEGGLLPKIQSASQEINEKLALIRSVYAEIVGDEEDKDAISVKDNLDALVFDFEASKKRIEDFKKKIFGSVKKNEAGEVIETTKGLSGEIDEFFSSGKKEYEKLMNDINKRLSPGATSVELAETFQEKVKEYSSVSGWWIAGFIIIVLSASIYYGFVVFYNTPSTTFEQVWIQLLFRAPFLALVIWLAMFISNRRAESKKLEEAYKHKEVMARTYTGYRKAIEDLDENDTLLLKTHMENLLNTINKDPGAFLNSKGEQHPFLAFFEGLFTKKTVEQSPKS